MNKRIATSILCIWSVIIALLLNEVFNYSLLHNNLGFFETLAAFTESTHSKLLSYGVLTPLLFILGYSIRPLLFFPASIMTMTSVFLFGPFQGFFISYVGEIASACVAFFVGKYFGEELGITQKVTRTNIGSYFTSNTFVSVFLLRLVPLFPFDFVNYASGIFKLPFKKYIVATALGTLPGLAIYIFLGNSLISGEYIPLAATIMLLLVVGGLWAKKKYEKRT